MNEDIVERGASGPTAALSSAGLPTAATLPRCRMASESQSSSASSMPCVVIRTVMLKVAAQFQQALPHGAARDGIEADGGLVEKQDGGTVQHGLRDFEAANHSAGICFHELVWRHR